MKYIHRGYDYITNEHYGKQVLQARGIEDVEHYLNTTEEDLYPLELIDNIEKAANLLIDHIQADSNIFILPDSDQDGITSSAIIWNHIKWLNPDAKLHFVMHEGKQHGLMEHMIKPEYDLYIIPDAGSNQYKIHEKLHNMDKDIIVIDHHYAEKESEHAVVVNNQLSDRYPNKELSGAGMALKFCMQLDEILGTNYAERQYDLAAIGIVGDMMSLTNPETRYIVDRGLSDIQNPALKAIIEGNSYVFKNSTITPTDVSFNIAPLTNAVTRVGTDEDKFFLFKAYTEGDVKVQDTKRGAKKGELETYANQFVRLGGNARSRQNNQKAKIVEEIEMTLKKEGADERVIILASSESIDNPALTGVIANEISNKYKKPTLITRPADGNCLKGSGRNIDREELPDFREYLEETGLVEFAQGHPNAFGVSVPEHKVDELLKLADDDFEHVNFNSMSHEVDFVFDGNDKDLHKCIIDIDDFKGVWGKGVEEPSFAITNINLLRDEVQVIGTHKNTIRFNYNGVSFIKFWAKEDIEDFQRYGSMRITVVGKATVNEWAGRKTPQIFIDDYDIVDTTYEF